jgi:hypothetical protein
MIIPAASWSIRVIRGDITSGESLNLTMENVITYSISMLTLLVTIITLGVGFIAVFGYQQIKIGAHNTAVSESRKVADKIVTDYFKQHITQQSENEDLRINYGNQIKDILNLKKNIREEDVGQEQLDLNPDEDSTIKNDSTILETEEGSLLSDDKLI